MATPFKIKLNNSAKFQKVLKGEPQSFGMRSGRVVLKPKEEVGEHNTGKREELIVIFEGKGRLFYGKRLFKNFTKGDVLYVSPNTVHNMANTGRKLLKYIYIVSPVSNRKKK